MPLLSLLRSFVAGAALLVFAGADDSPHTKDPLPTVKRRVEADEATLLDVREKAEWQAGHLEKAQFLPLSELGKRLRDPEYVAGLRERLPKDKPIYLHCKAGGRCVLAAQALKTELGAGYDLRPLKPGYAELVQAGFEPADVSEAK